MINILIPSCDRASQLRLLLESIRTNCPNVFRLHILWRARTEQFLKGYRKLQEEIKDDVIWIKEVDCHTQFFEFINSDFDHLGFMTDDCIFYRKLDTVEGEIKTLLAVEDVWAVHLRSGTNTLLHDYVNKTWLKPMTVLNSYFDKKFVEYNFREYPVKGLGYPTHWDGAIYRSKDIRWLTEGLKINNLRDVESYWYNMNGRINQQHIICPAKSCICVQQINSTHDRRGFHGAFVNVSPEELNDRYLNDEIIDLESFDFTHINSFHVELPFKYKKI